MRKIKVSGLQYILSEDPVEDRLLRKASRHSTWLINYSNSRLLMPHLDALEFISLMGRERGPLDDWDDFELRLYARLQRLPQHFRLLDDVVLRRSDRVITDFVAVYSLLSALPCGCEYCERGQLGLIEDTERALAAPRTMGDRSPEEDRHEQ